MGFSSNLDLEELLNYMVSGSFVIAILTLGYSKPITLVTDQIEASVGSNLSIAALLVIFTTSALVLGHILSMAARYIIRPLMNTALGDPENAVLSDDFARSGKRACSAFFTDQFKTRFDEKYEKVFGCTPKQHIPLSAIPRVVRSHVLHHSDSALQIRDRIVRSRSFCANLGVAFLLSSLLNVAHFGLVDHALLIGGATLMFIKQRSLDERESKEIYTHFLAI